RASSSRTHTQSGSGRDFGRGAGFAVAGYSRCSSSSSSRLSTTSQLVSPAALARCRHSATAVLPQPVARAIRRQLDTPANRCKRSMSLIFRIASLCWATVSLLGKRAKRGGEKGLRRDAPPAGGCYRSRAGDRGQRSEIMADSVPLRPPKCPPSGRNTVRHAAGMVSAIGPESCPSWAGTRTRPPTQVMVAYIDQHKDRFGVEPICSVLPIAPSTYHEHKAREREPELRPERAKRDDALKPEVQRVWDENYRVYGAHKVWKQLNREGIEVARCTIERLMRDLGLRGVVRGKRIRTTIPDELQDRRLDRVNRIFTVPRPNALWVADLSYVATWRGVVYVAFVIDAFARRIVGWRVSSSLRSDIALDALEQALYDRDIGAGETLIHHSDRGVQYVSIRYTERLAEAGIEPSVGSVGDSYDNALAETIIGLYKT